MDADGWTLLGEGDVASMRPRLPDSLLQLSRRTERRSLLLGPRWRRFLRPTRGVTPFLDLHAAGTYNSLRVRTSAFHRERRRFGGEAGAGLGIEWFPGSPVTLAVQSTVVAIRLERESLRVDDPQGSAKRSQSALTVLVELLPVLYLRVYF